MDAEPVGVLLAIVVLAVVLICAVSLVTCLGELLPLSLLAVVAIFALAVVVTLGLSMHERACRKNSNSKIFTRFSV